MSTELSPTIAALLANRKRKRGEANDEEDQENGAGTTNNDRETAEVLQPEKVRRSVYLVHQMTWSTMVVVQSMPKCLIVGAVCSFCRDDALRSNSIQWKTWKCIVLQQS